MPREIPRKAKKDYKEDELDEPIQSPNPVAPASGRLIVKRDGHSITRQIPKPTVLIDTREKTPFEFKQIS